MREHIRKITAAIRNALALALIDRSDPDGKFAQVQSISGRVTPEVPILQPQGVHFRAPASAVGVAASPQGIADNVVMMSVSDRENLPILPPVLAEGEGGLHYLGTFKVFLNADGSVSLGDVAATDYVALASLVLAQLQAIKTAFDAHTHTGVTTGTGVSGQPATPMSAPSSVAATLVKAL